MARFFHRDPTEFFSVVGAPYVHEHRTETHFPRPFEIGVAAGGVIFCLAILGFSLFADSGLARLAEVAHHVVR